MILSTNYDLGEMRDLLMGKGIEILAIEQYEISFLLEGKTYELLIDGTEVDGFEIRDSA